MTVKTTKDIIVVEHQPSGISNVRVDEDMYPFVLNAVLRPPEFMDVAFIFMYGGSETLIVRGKTRQALLDYAHDPELRLFQHPRLRRLTLHSPDSVETLYPLDND